MAVDGFERLLSESVEEAIASHQAFLAERARAGRAASAIRDALYAGRQVLAFGNGGSGTDAQHLAVELVVRFSGTRRAFPAVALSADGAIASAVGNDLGFGAVFGRQIEALGRPGDVALGITTSGNSPNVVEGLRTAKSKGLMTVALTGRGGGEAAGIADFVVNVPSDSTARIQEVHRTWIHALCEWIDEGL